VSWTAVKLGQISQLHYGKSLSGYSAEATDECRIRVFGTNGPIGWTKTALTEQPTLVIGRKGAYRGVNICEEPSWTIDTAFYTTIDENLVVLKWLYYRLRQLDINRMNSGGAIPSTSREDFYAAEIRIPSLTVQRWIADILSAYDDLIENNRRRIALLEQAARMLYREWFVHFRFPGHEHVKMIDGLPEGWERRPLGSVLNLQRGFDLPVGDRDPGSIPVYGSTGIVGEHNVAKVSVPTLITGRSGSLGTVCFVDDPCWPLNTSLWVTTFMAVSVYFAYFMLSELNLAKFNGGASVPTLDRKVAHAASVIIPNPLLASLFDEQAKILFAQRKLLDQQNHKLAQARDLLLPRLMSGEIAV
jgi:type I restriction enzyme S subunit